MASAQQSGPQVTVITAPILGQDPTTVRCSSCHEMVATRTTTSPTGKTHLIAVAMCFFQCWICIPCLYCCCKSWQATQHYCTRCNHFLGSYSAI